MYVYLRRRVKLTFACPPLAVLPGAYLQCNSCNSHYINISGCHLLTLWRRGKREDKVLAARSCLTLCNPLDCGPLGSSVHGISQAEILDWVAIPFSRGSSRPRD